MVAVVRSWWRKRPLVTWGVLAVVAAAALLGFYVLQAQAATQRLYPNSTTSSGTWSIAWEDTIHAAIDDPWDAHDGAKTYVWTNTPNDAFVVGLSDPVVGVGTISTVKVFARVATGERFNFGYDYTGSGVTWDTTNRASLDFNTLSSMVIPPPSGGWTAANLRNLQVGIRSVADGAWIGNSFVTQVYVEVEYVPTTVVIGDGNDPAASDVTVGQSDVSVDGFSLQRTTGTEPSIVGKITVTNTGTGIPSATISGVDIYRDANFNGTFDPGIDTKLNTTSGTFSGTTSVVTLTSGELVDATLKNYFVVYSFSATAATGGTANANVRIAGGDYAGIDVLTDNDDTGNSFTVRHTAFVIGDGPADPAPAKVAPGKRDVPVDQFTTRQTAGGTPGTLHTVTVTKTGTALISAVDIYTDANANGVIDGADASVGSGTFTGAVATIDLADQTIDSTVRAYLVVYDVDPAATDGQTMTGEITAASYTDMESLTESDNTGSTFTVSTAVVDTEPPSTPRDVVAVGGNSAPTVVYLTWTKSSDNVRVTGYRVLRAVGSSGIYVKVGVATASESPSLSDTTGAPAQTYYYKVVAYDAAGNDSAASIPSMAAYSTWVTDPHQPSTGDTAYCAWCHAPHSAVADKLLRNTGSPSEGQDAVCSNCHGKGGGDANVKTGRDSFGQASGHSLEWAPNETLPATRVASQLTNDCAGCHSFHRDSTANPKLPTKKITTLSGSVEPTTTSNSWCEACHNEADDWYGPGYPSASAPTRDATGYPVLGTFPGPTVYRDPAANAHSAIPASASQDNRPKGSCLYCHAAHRGSNGYDGLMRTFRPTTLATLADDQANGTYAAACFYCHGGSTPSELSTAPTDIRRFVAAGFIGSGHRIRSSGASLPVGAPLPCYECHNPHGSSRNNKQLLSDALGRSLGTTTAAGEGHRVREFCFTCHTTADTAAGWDSVASTLSVGASAGKRVVGLSRDATSGVNDLRLSDVVGHRTADIMSCYGCHGSDYSGIGGNVHNPDGGVNSAGGIDCYQCHTTYQSYMEDDSGAKKGSNNATVYHHVLGDATTYDGDKAFAAGSYPTSLDNVYCLSCHVDHDKSNGFSASNLRSDIASNNPSGVSTDYDSTKDAGICTGCHASSRTKQGMGTEQFNDGSTATPKIAAGSGPNQFGASAHDYYATSKYEADSFSANCSKCHNDEQARVFQTSDAVRARFGTHWSAPRRILSALGSPAVDPLQERHCYRCHSAQTDLLGGVQKIKANRDWYDAADMSAASERVWAQFQLASTHPVEAVGGNSVECESCHNAHVVNKTTAKVTDPENGYNATAYTSDNDKVTFCLKCHDQAPPTYTVSSTIYVPFTVTQANATLNDKSTYDATSKPHWRLTGTVGGVTGPVSCPECHDDHGSKYAPLLGVFDAANPADDPKINGASVTGNNNTVCEACHSAAGTLPYTRNASGYPVSGAWPGKTVYDSANGIHRSSTVRRPGMGFAGGLCINCHDVHGSSNTYDSVLGTFSETNFGSCFECHDADGPAESIRNIKRYYPSDNGGLATQTSQDNFGHKIQSPTGTLPAGSGLPCYDCHNPHGSGSADGILVMTMNNSQVTAIGDGAGEIDMTSVAGRRRFCFLCHTTADVTAQGTNPAAPSSDAYINITTGSGTAVIEGISRTVYNSTSRYGLKLPPAAGHYASDLTRDCYSCHGSDYSGVGSNNVHNPGPG